MSTAVSPTVEAAPASGAIDELPPVGSVTSPAPLPHAVPTTARRPATVAAAATFLSIALPVTMLGVVWPVARLELGQSLGALGLATSLYGVARMAVAAVGRPLARRVGMGTAVLGGLVAYTVACAALAVAPSWPAFAAAIIALGVTSGVLDSLVTLSIATAGDVGDAGVIHGAFGVGATVAPLLVAVVPDWRAALLLCVVAAAGAAGLAVRARSGWPAPSPMVRAAAAGARAGRRTPWTAVAVSLGVIFSIVAVEVSLSQWTATWLVAARGLGAPTAAIAVSAYWGASTVMRLAMARRRTARFVERHGLPRMAAVAAVVLAVIATVPVLPGPAAVVAFAVAGTAMAPVIPTLQATTAARVGDDLADRVAGWQLLAFNLGAVSGVALIGLLVDAVGSGTAMVVIAATLVVAGLPLLVAAHRLATRSHQAV